MEGLFDTTLQRKRKKMYNHLKSKSYYWHFLFSKEIEIPNYLYMGNLQYALWSIFKTQTVFLPWNKKQLVKQICDQDPNNFISPSPHK